MTTWIASQNKNGNLRFLLIATLTWLLCFIKSIIGKTYTSWDTHDIGFVNFLYFSDSLRSGSFPLWNHFIQSGTFFPSLNNIGLFSPFQLIFVALSWLISPVYAYELMIQMVVLTGAVGSYLLCRSYTSDRLIALFGAIAFAVAVLVPIVGQIAFVVSLSSLPWLVFACIKITSTRGSSLLYLILGVLGAFYLVSGYIWMNLVNLIIVAIFSLGLLVHKYARAQGQYRKMVTRSLVNLLIFFGSMIFLYACLVLPGYLSMSFNYSLFNGDYATPEPRLRSLMALQHYSYSSIYKVLVGTVDPRIVMNNGSWMAEMPMWFWGGGWVLVILFLGTSTRKFLAMQLFWLGLLTVALLYSAGDDNFLGKLVKATPILNANRWWYIGVAYAMASLVFLTIPRLMALKERAGQPQQIFSLPVHELQVLLVGALSACLLYYFKSPPLQFVLVGVIVALLLLLNRTRNHALWQNLLSILIGINVLAIASMPYAIPSHTPDLIASGAGGYSQQIREREKNVDITKNFRTVGKGDIYIFNDQQWLLRKIPFTHGYNNLGNPFVWYVKNEPYLERLLVVTQNVRQEVALERKSFASDYEFVKTMMGDALAEMDRPTIDAGHFHRFLQRPDFKWQLDELKVEPNTASMRVSTNAAAYLVFNNVEHPGWEAYINGKKAELVRTNRIFQGVFLPQAGSHEVVFKFRPVLTITLILLPYIILLLCLVASIQKFRHLKQPHAN